MDAQDKVWRGHLPEIQGAKLIHINPDGESLVNSRHQNASALARRGQIVNRLGRVGRIAGPYRVLKRTDDPDMVFVSLPCACELASRGRSTNRSGIGKTSTGPCATTQVRARLLYKRLKGRPGYTVRSGHLIGDRTLPRWSGLNIQGAALCGVECGFRAAQAMHPASCATAGGFAMRWGLFSPLPRCA